MEIPVRAVHDTELMKPYTVTISDEVLADLRTRLRNTRWPDQLDGAGWDYGTERTYLRELCRYWTEEFDWRKQEAALNRFDHFETEIQGMRIHFVHQRSPHPDAMPLIITHGWPGSIVEFLKVLGPLTDPGAHGADPRDAFHVVCPSIPGYGFSSAPRTPGFDIRRVADVNKELMALLGYERYGAQGGDWGAVATAWLGLIDAERLHGIHINMPLGRRPEGATDDELSATERQRLEQARAFSKTETGYQRIQGTKPQTLAYGLNDSPVGLAAWIVEKFRTWSDCGGDVESRFTKDELLTNITIYWATRTIASSVRLYYETMKLPRFGLPDSYVSVPTGCAVFPKELSLLPRSWIEHAFKLVHWTEMPRGGHFAAMEEPELFVGDVRSFFRRFR